MCFKPSLREISRQLGGKIEDTRTILHAAMPALRRANSKLDSRSRCLPTPLVRKILFATNAMYDAERRCLLLSTRDASGKFSWAGRKVARSPCAVNHFPVKTEFPARWPRGGRPRSSRLAHSDRNRASTSLRPCSNFKSVGLKSAPQSLKRLALARDLHHADDLAASNDRRAHQLLDMHALAAP